MSDILIAGCTYRLDGYLDASPVCPSGGAVWYLLSTPGLRETCHPAHARAACRAWRETITALLLAGF